MKHVFVLAVAFAGCSYLQTQHPGKELAGHSSPLLVSSQDLCVTEGELRDTGDHHFEVRSPAMRAVVRSETSPAAEMQFVYHGPTRETAALASGEVRRQIGLKLRAQDSCNVVYVMWRIEPESKLVVSVKHNPGERLHSECEAGGYRSIEPRLSRPIAKVIPGEVHRLRAQMNDDALEVFADGELVWQGELGPDALSFEGPVGMRTDNGRFELEFAVASSDALSGGEPAGCTKEPGAD